MRRKIVTPLVLATVSLSLLLAAGCAQREAVNFNNSIANASRKLNEAGSRFNKAISPALKGDPVDLGEVKAAYDGLVATLDQVKKDMPPPRPAESRRGGGGRPGRSREQGLRSTGARQDDFAFSWTRRALRGAAPGAISGLELSPDVYLRSSDADARVR